MVAARKSRRQLDSAMLRKLVILGIVAGGSAWVPALYESNPELFENIVRSAVEKRAPEPEPQRPLVIIQQAKMEAPKEQLTGRKVRLEADERGHFRGDFRINGRSLDAMVDTGATMIAINRTTARQVGVHLTPADFRYEVNTANGTIKAAAAMLANVQIGRIQLDNVEAMVLEDRALSGTLVGMSFLRRLASFRVENGTLVMEQ
jgi:aspartyl protease family protein